MTGPSLAGIWGRKAGTVEGFTRYSDALKESGIVWDEHTLDAWLEDPSSFLPGNRMTFRGVPDEAQRQDLIEYLRSVSSAERAPSDKGDDDASQETSRQGQLLDLKTLDSNNRITSITHCGDTYTVTVETRESFKFWEFNLRIKTDSSENGPMPGKPVLIPSGMMGDRAFVVFSTPSEISTFIESQC